jgi:hypothetical protein
MVHSGATGGGHDFVESAAAQVTPRPHLTNR